MNELQIFSYQSNEVRTVMIDGEPWFVGKDVAIALGYKDTVSALKSHVDDDDKRGWRITTPSGTQEMNIINESGVYSLVFSSKLPSAKKFKHWVTSEVLPAVRKHGAYMTPDTIEKVLADPDTIIKLATSLKEEREKRRLLEEQAKANKPKVLFAESVSASKDSILVRELATLLRQNGVSIGQNRLFAWLRGNGYLIKRRGTDYNMPTQKSMELGLFEIRETVINRSDGSPDIKKSPRVTGKGQRYFIDRFLGEGRGSHEAS